MKYESCWFEIRTDEKRMMLTRDHDSFVRTAQVLSKLHNLALYRIETGKKQRIFSRVLSEPGTQENFAFLELRC